MQQPQANGVQPQAPQMHTMVFYFVPEDKDELSTPNAYIIRRPVDEINLDLIEREFPMEGQFLFRFKYNHTGQTVWLDLSNKKCPVPKYDGKIIIKVTRKVAKNTEAATSAQPAQPNLFSAQSQAQPPSMDLLDMGL